MNNNGNNVRGESLSILEKLGIAKDIELNIRNAETTLFRIYDSATKKEEYDILMVAVLYYREIYDGKADKKLILELIGNSAIEYSHLRCIKLKRKFGRLQYN